MTCGTGIDTGADEQLRTAMEPTDTNVPWSDALTKVPTRKVDGRTANVQFTSEHSAAHYWAASAAQKRRCAGGRANEPRPSARSVALNQR